MRTAALTTTVLLAALAPAWLGCAADTLGEPLYEGDRFVIEPVNASTIPDKVREADADFVLVNFWASWCAPCRDEFPDFMRFDEKHASVTVRFVSVDVEEDLEYTVAFLEEEGVTGPTFMRVGEEQAFFTDVNPEWIYAAIPATAVYDRNGNQLAFWQGKVDYNGLSERVAALRTSS